MPIERLDGSEMSEAELNLAYQQLFGVDEEEAAFIIAMERGEVLGDIVMVDENGNETDEPPRPA